MRGDTFISLKKRPPAGNMGGETLKIGAGRGLLRGTQKHGRGGFLQNNEFLGKIPEISLKSQKLCGEASKYGRGETSCGGIDNLVRGGILKNP